MGNRRELRALLQRLITLPKENLEAVGKYGDGSPAQDTYAALVVQEQALLGRQAAEIATRLPSSEISAAELLDVGQALGNFNDLEEELQFLLRAVNSPSDMLTELAVWRSLGQVYFLLNRADDGRAAFRMAKDIFSRHRPAGPTDVPYTDAFTELSWAEAESLIKRQTLVKEHLDLAEERLIQLQSDQSPRTVALRGRLAQYRRNLAAGDTIEVRSDTNLPIANHSP